ncbi:MAG: TetR/AcrR family transcriptional regulator [Janthinobacterium lividum]
MNVRRENVAMDDDVVPDGAPSGAKPVEGGARAPRQARGKARVEAILDATAAVIVEKGLAGVTMHGVAKQASTPVGSMYHFFPDRDALLDALQERHADGTAEIGRKIDATAAEQWRALSPSAVVDRLVTPYIRYLESHPDCLSFMSRKGPQLTKGDAMLRYKAVIDARLPHATPAARQLYADMLNSLALGCMVVKFGAAAAPVEHAGQYMREVQRALAAYLTAIEAATAA